MKTGVQKMFLFSTVRQCGSQLTAFPLLKACHVTARPEGPGYCIIRLQGLKGRPAMVAELKARDHANVGETRMHELGVLLGRFASGIVGARPTGRSASLR